ncbi:MAG TPA: vitamin K epoxide reductase family protein [Candidatus Saccharimonadales bacterium]|nr:vitamin K epoxide reductase family protein [Candidatus Saccharimonadales bacterium]
MFSKTNQLTARWALVIFSIFALIASFVLSFDEIKLLKNANTQLSCSVNLVVNCASVMKSSQASLVGDIPNPFWGIIGFTAALTLAVVLLSGIKLPRWMMNAMQVGFGLGWLFALWLFSQSVYVIQILCPWCLVVTASTSVLFLVMLRLNLLENNFGFNKRLDKSLHEFIGQKYDVMLTIAIIVILAALIFVKFGDALFA